MDAAPLLAALRRRHGLTQAALALRAGTSQPVVSAYEHGRRDPSTATLRRLVEAGGERLVLEARMPLVSSMTSDGPQAHGDRLVDLLSLVDAVPARRRAARLDAARLVSQ